MSTSLPLGQMRHSLKVVRRAASPQDAAGEPQLTWTLVAERRCALERAPGKEVWAAAGRNQRVPVVFRMRYEQQVFDALRSGSDDVRVNFDGREHDIISCVDPDGLKVEMRVTTSEHVEEPA